MISIHSVSYSVICSLILSETVYTLTPVDTFMRHFIVKIIIQTYQYINVNLGQINISLTSQIQIYEAYTVQPNLKTHLRWCYHNI